MRPGTYPLRLTTRSDATFSLTVRGVAEPGFVRQRGRFYGRGGISVASVELVTDADEKTWGVKKSCTP